MGREKKVIMVEDYILIEEAMYNGYKIATGKMTIEDLLDEDENMVSAFYPEMQKKRKITSIENMIGYFECEEQYEKCAELLLIKEKIES